MQANGYTALERLDAYIENLQVYVNLVDGFRNASIQENHVYLCFIS